MITATATWNCVTWVTQGLYRTCADKINVLVWQNDPYEDTTLLFNVLFCNISCDQQKHWQNQTKHLLQVSFGIQAKLRQICIRITHVCHISVGSLSEKMKSVFVLCRMSAFMLTSFLADMLIDCKLLNRQLNSKLLKVWIEMSLLCFTQGKRQWSNLYMALMA